MKDYYGDAVRYVDQQIATMEKYGSCPNLTPEGRVALVAQMERVFRKMHMAAQARRKAKGKA